jgi:hypothetical protein
MISNYYLTKEISRKEKFVVNAIKLANVESFMESLFSMREQIFGVKIRQNKGNLLKTAALVVVGMI